MAEGGEDVDLNVDPFHCTLCLQEFDSPRFLPCFHMFCYKCLETLIEKNASQGTFSCPVCRKVTNVPNSGVKGFTSNFYLTSNSRKVPEKLQQVNCDTCEKPATSRCLECGETYCSECASCHTKMKMSRDHHLEDLDSLNQEVKSKCLDNENCSEHKSRRLQLLCKTCDAFICTECQVTSHEGHTWENTADTAMHMRQDVFDSLNLERLESWVDILSHDTDVLRRHTKQLEEDTETSVKAIRVFSECVQKRLEEMIKKLKSANRNEIQSSEDQIEDFAKKHDFFLELVSDAKQVVNGSNDLDVIRSRRLLNQKLKDSCTYRGTLCVTHERQHLGFVPKERAIQNLDSSLGTLENKIIHLDIRSVKLRSEPELVSTFQIVKGEVTSIAPLSGGKAWILIGYELYMVDISGTVLLKVTVDRDSPGRDIATDEENCYVSVSKSIKMVTPHGTVKNLCHTGMHPYGLDLTPGKQHLVVCLHNLPRNLELNRLTKYTKDGKKLLDMIVNNNCQNALGQPRRVCINEYGILCVSDLTVRVINGIYKSHNKLVFLSCYSKEKCIYEPEHFSPKDICWDHYDGLIAANSCSEGERGVHYLDSSGRLLKILYKTSDTCPTAVAVDEQNQLWLGCDDGTVSVMKYMY